MNNKQTILMSIEVIFIVASVTLMTLFGYEWFQGMFTGEQVYNFARGACPVWIMIMLGFYGLEVAFDCPSYKAKQKEPDTVEVTPVDVTITPEEDIIDAEWSYN